MKKFILTIGTILAAFYVFSANAQLAQRNNAQLYLPSQPASGDQPPVVNTNSVPSSYPWKLMEFANMNECITYLANQLNIELMVDQVRVKQLYCSGPSHSATNPPVIGPENRTALMWSDMGGWN
ncbi:MAG: hypothetical protein FWG39_04055 [Alphaproteobacteria bacterium]|nr:hypothetical protein [Alphaproteobacteria bacterium]